MSFWPVVVGVSTVGLTLFIFLRLKRLNSSKMRSATLRNLRGKVAIITGASSGLGREVAYQLARCQADVIMACRDRAKTQKAIEFIQSRLRTEPVPRFSSSTNQSTDQSNQLGKLHVMDLDLSDLRSVDTFVDEFQSKFSDLHILINNGGVMACPYGRSRSGSIESHFAINHLGHFYLTERLAPILKRSAPSRVLIVTSGYYRKMAPSGSSSENASVPSIFDPVDKPQEPNYDPLRAYARSKLANCLHGVELAKRFKNDDVDVFVIRPGFVRGTDLGRHFNGLLTTLAKPLIWLFSQSVEQGAQTYLYCATADRGAPLESGALYYNCEAQPYVQRLVNDRNAAEMWTLSERLVQKEKEALGKHH